MKLLSAKIQINPQTLSFLALIILLTFTISALPAESQADRLGLAHAAPTAGELIYDDALQAGWSTDNIGFIDVNESATFQVFEGSRSVEVVFQNQFSRFHFVSDTPFSVSDYDSISFQIFSSDAGQTLSFELWDSGFASLGQVAVPLVTNNWSAVTIDFSNFADSNDVTYVQFSNSSTTSPIYFDNVVLGDTDILTPTPVLTNTPTSTSTATPIPPTATPLPNTPTPTIPAGPAFPQYLYTDGVESSWSLTDSGTISQNPSSTTQVYDGDYALEISFSNSSSFAFFKSNIPLNTTDFDSISFWLYGSENDQSIDLGLLKTNTNSLNDQPITVSPSTWTFITIDIAEFNESSDLRYLIFRNASSSSPIYIDNLSLNRRSAPELMDSIYLPIGVRE